MSAETQTEKQARCGDGLTLPFMVQFYNDLAKEKLLNTYMNVSNHPTMCELIGIDLSPELQGKGVFAVYFESDTDSDSLWDGWDTFTVDALHGKTDIEKVFEDCYGYFADIVNDVRERISEQHESGTDVFLCACLVVDMTAATPACVLMIHGRVH